MTKVDVCANGRSFEWRSGELFLVSDQIQGNTVWFDSGFMDRVRRECPFPNSSDEFPVYIIVRGPDGDQIMAVETPITFAGGDVLCFVKPLVTHWRMK